MDLLQKLPSSSSLSKGLRYGQGSKTAFAAMTSFEPADIEALGQIEEANLALFIPAKALLIRDEMEQNWLINLPKGKGEETLYSTSFFWNPSSEEAGNALELAQQREWAVYTELESKLCLLVINSRVGVDVDAEAVLGQLI